MPTETFALRGQTVIITSHGVHAPVDGDPGWVVGRLREGQQEGAHQLPANCTPSKTRVGLRPAEYG